MGRPCKGLESSYWELCSLDELPSEARSLNVYTWLSFFTALIRFTENL